MKSEKLKILLSRLENTSSDEKNQIDFVSLNDDFAIQLKGGNVAGSNVSCGNSNGSCSHNVGCSGNTACSNNGGCSANAGCGGNEGCWANQVC